MSGSGFLGLGLRQVRGIAKWTAVVVPMSAVVGTLCGFFLWALDQATQARFDILC
jgi:hypothetical protein